MMHRRIAVTCCGIVAAIRLEAQTVNQAMVWAAVFGDHRIGAKSALHWDYQARRADFGETWQIMLSAIGYTRDLTGEWRTTASLGAMLGYRYGAFKARTNSFELRPMIQLTGARPLGSFTWSDRIRAEVRMLHPVGSLAPEDADWLQSVVRLRRQDKLTHRISRDGRWYGAAASEFFVNVLPERARVGMLEQVRGQIVLGRVLTPHNRLETGYGLQYVNRRGGLELNHTLIVNYRTTVPIR
jgi:Protein of unknown function (DUF2490)